MLEMFEKTVIANEKAEEEDFAELSEWLAESDFPNTTLPKDYKTLISESNGGDFVKGEREYQFLSLKEVAEYYDAYGFADFMPFAFPFAMDGCGNFFLFDFRANDGKVYGVSSGDMGWDDDQCFQIADSFIECLAQTDLITEHFN